jgi:hypothetical protein
MRRPHRARNISLTVALMGAACLALGIGLGDPPVYPILQNTLFFSGLFLFPIPFFGVFYFQVEAGRYDRLVSGKDVLARWHVDPERWEAFLRLNTALNAQKDRPSFHPSPASKGVRPPPGVEVVVGKGSVLIDGDFYSLPRGGISQIYGPYWIEGPPPLIEFHVHTSSENSTHRESVRIPVGAGAQVEAVEAFNHYTSRMPVPRPQNHRLRRNVALVVALVTGAAAGAVLLNVANFNEHREYQLAAMITAIAGVLICPAALLCAVVWHFRHRRRLGL